MVGRYLDGGAEVSGDLPAVALEAGPDVARNPDELQVPGGVVDAVYPGLGGQGALVEQGLGGLRGDGHGRRLGQLLEGGDGEAAWGAAVREAEGGRGGEGGAEEAAVAGAERGGKARRREAAVEDAMDGCCR